MKTLVKPVLLSFLLEGLQEAEAQPRILRNPGNTAVEFGADGRFEVGAIGAPPLMYQWRFNGRAMEGATGRILEVTNVTLDELGRYDVVLSNDTGETTSEPGWLLFASRWKEFVVFGASEALPICAGPAWPNYLVNRLGVRLRNYASGGANSSQVRQQIILYLSQHAPGASTLIGLWTGGAGVDFVFGGASAEQAASSRLANLRLLAEAGARSFLLPTFPDPKNTDAGPGFAHVTTELNEELNIAMDKRLDLLRRDYPVEIHRPDMVAFFLAVWEDPAAYGVGNPNEPNTPDIVCENLHFTTTVHSLIAQQCYRSWTPPLTIESSNLTPDGNVELNWSGGSPPFRIESSTDLSSDAWAPVGGVQSVHGTILPRESPNEFIRVLFLGQ